jgi:hypothetical protein
VKPQQVRVQCMPLHTTISLDFCLASALSQHLRSTRQTRLYSLNHRVLRAAFSAFSTSHTLLSVARHVGSTAFLHNQGAYQMHLPLGILYPLHHLQIVGIHHSSMAAAHSSSNSICHFL